MGVDKEAVQALSYQIWEREGRPHGRDQEHWFQAEAELAREQAKLDAAARSTSPRARASKNRRGKAAKKS